MVIPFLEAKQSYFFNGLWLQHVGDHFKNNVAKRDVIKVVKVQ